jgi:hypothetical protein
MSTTDRDNYIIGGGVIGVTAKHASNVKRIRRCVPRTFRLATYVRDTLLHYNERRD